MTRWRPPSAACCCQVRCRTEVRRVRGSANAVATCTVRLPHHQAAPVGIVAAGRSDDEVAAELFDMLGDSVFEHIGGWPCSFSWLCCSTLLLELGACELLLDMHGTRCVITSVGGLVLYKSTKLLGMG